MSGQFNFCLRAKAGKGTFPKYGLKDAFLKNLLEVPKFNPAVKDDFYLSHKGKSFSF
jgi:hypothetical protein